MSAAGKVSPEATGPQNPKKSKVNKWTYYEQFVYATDLLVPQIKNHEIVVPPGHFLQQVHSGENERWRSVKDKRANLPDYLTDFNIPETNYYLIQQNNSIFQTLDPTSKFLKKWDGLALTLLVFTASVTPFETAFLVSDSIAIHIDLLFLINRFVDVVFFTDMFVQCRTPYRDDTTGKLILSVRSITVRYLTSWFIIDLVSVLPFEFLGNIIGGGQNSSLSQLSILRFFRLTRLLKLLRVFRASRKLKKLQISSNLRYATLELLKITVVTIFMIHWLACFYRIAAERGGESEAAGWVDHYLTAKNMTSESTINLYLAAVYYTSSVISLVGCSQAYLQPSNYREYIFAVLANLVAYLLMMMSITSISHIFMLTNETSRKQDVLVDNYLGLFDNMKLNQQLKITVFDYLTDLFTTESNTLQTKMLRDLPPNMHGFIATESFIEFVEQVPWLEPFIDREPELVREICRAIEIRNVTQNNFVFTNGCDGIYFLERGIVAIEGKLYITGDIFGLTVLRDNEKVSECRALTNLKIYVITKTNLCQILMTKPKIMYYAKRWTQWEILRMYIRAYTKLYYTAAQRGALMSPQLLSRRPFEGGIEDLDDIDIAVLDHLQDSGF